MKIKDKKQKKFKKAIKKKLQIMYMMELRINKNPYRTYNLHLNRININ